MYRKTGPLIISWPKCCVWIMPDLLIIKMVSTNIDDWGKTNSYIVERLEQLETENSKKKLNLCNLQVLAK